MDVSNLECRAQALLKTGCLWQAQIIYTDITEMLLKAMTKEKNSGRKKAMKVQLEAYRKRMKNLESLFDFNGFQLKASIVATVHIAANTFNYDFGALFAKYCFGNVQEIVIYESSMCHPGHFQNLLNFVRHIKQSCKTLQYVLLKCRVAGELINQGRAEEQRNLIMEFRRNWPWDELLFDCMFSERILRDEHKIVFNNGFVFYFKKSFNYFTYNSPNDKDKPLSRTCANDIIIWHSEAFEEGRWRSML